VLTVKNGQGCTGGSVKLEYKIGQVNEVKQGRSTCMGMEEGTNGAATHSEIMQGARGLKDQANNGVAHGGGRKVGRAPNMSQSLHAM
jgi:hypothetical protein